MWGRGVRERIRWSEVESIEIRTTDQGPWGEDFFFVLLGPGGKPLIVPNEIAQGTGLLERLQQFPGFDNTKVIEASSCTDNARFVCWEAVASAE